MLEVENLTLENFDDVICLNFLLDITEHCDCFGSYMESISPDIGILGSKDLVAADKASIDLIGKYVNFKELHGVSPEIQVEEGEKIGLGSIDYELIKI